MEKTQASWTFAPLFLGTRNRTVNGTDSFGPNATLRGASTSKCGVRGPAISIGPTADAPPFRSRKRAWRDTSCELPHPLMCTRSGMVYRLTMGLQATAEIADRRDWTQSSLLSLQLVIAYRMRGDSNSPRCAGWRDAGASTVNWVTPVSSTSDFRVPRSSCEGSNIIPLPCKMGPASWRFDHEWSCKVVT